MIHNYTITIYNIGYNYNIAIYLYSHFEPPNITMIAMTTISHITGGDTNNNNNNIIEY